MGTTGELFSVKFRGIYNRKCLLSSIWKMRDDVKLFESVQLSLCFITGLTDGVELEVCT